MMMVREVHKRPVFSAAALRVVDGVAIGDTLASVEYLILDDVYQLDQGWDAVANHLYDTCLQLEALLTFMTPTGATLQVLLLAAQGEVLFQPLDQMNEGVKYRLICCERQSAVRLLTVDTSAPVTDYRTA